MISLCRYDQGMQIRSGWTGGLEAGLKGTLPVSASGLALLCLPFGAMSVELADSWMSCAS